MKNLIRRSFLAFALGASLAFASCSGGGGAGEKVAAAGCKAGIDLCVTSCNLGCTSTGCTLTRIAVNQPIRMDFNAQILPESVTTETFKLRTAKGQPPVGSFLVQNNIVFFIPEVQTIDRNNFFFGFKSGETYTLTIPGIDSSLKTIQSRGGSQMAETFTCTLRVTEGVKDFDGKSPFASLLVPEQATNVSVDTSIILEFSEIINTSTLLDNNGALVGVTYGIAQFDNEGRCGSKEIPLPGTFTLSTNKLDQRTVLLYRPSGQLPGEVCIRVTVTDKVMDLANNRAKRATLEFKTRPAPTTTREIVEDFNDPLVNRDKLRDGTDWDGPGVVAGKLGGTFDSTRGKVQAAILGDFDIRFGGKDTGKKDSEGRQIFEWNTEKTVIPATRTMTGEDVTVSDGVYQFSSFVLGDKEHLRFIGTKGVQIHVTGEARIRGVISVSAPDVVIPKAVGSNGPPKGQAGQPGGPGGAAGGRGGDIPTLSKGSFNGAKGVPVTFFIGNHPLLAKADGTGGAGSEANPKDPKKLIWSYNAIISQMTAAGGAGGGFFGAGQPGTAIINKLESVGNDTPKPADLGKPSIPGQSLGILGLLQSSFSLPSRHLFLIGGSGGGGGGYGALGDFETNAPTWSSGCGGAGGGGWLMIRTGGSLTLSRTGKILAQGAAGQLVVHDFTGNFAPPAGGAGSGGSVLLQAGGIVDLRGEVSVLGGAAGRLFGWRPPSTGFLRVDAPSGAASSGLIRVEADPKPDYKSFDRFKPERIPENAGLLRKTDNDAVSTVASTWYNTRFVFPPKYLSYRIEAVVNGKPKVFSDVDAKSTRAKNGEALVIFFQGAQMDPNTKAPDPRTISTWVEAKIDALNLIGGNLYRWRLMLDQSKSSTTIKVSKLTIRFKG